MATSRPTGDEPYLQGNSGYTYNPFLRNQPEPAFVEREVDPFDPSTMRAGGIQRLETPSIRPSANPTLNTLLAPGIEQNRSLERRANASGYTGLLSGEAAGAFLAGQKIGNMMSGSTYRPFSTPIPGTQYTDAGAIPSLKHDASAPRLSGKNVAKFAGRAGVNAAATAAIDYGVDALTKESRKSQGEIIAEIVKRKYGKTVDPIEALTFYDQFMEDEGDLFDNPNVTTLGMSHNTASGLMAEGLGVYNPLAGSAFNAARNMVEKPGRMAQYEMLADRMNSEFTAGDIRDAAMRQYAGKYGVEGVKRRFPDLGWETWKSKKNQKGKE